MEEYISFASEVLSSLQLTERIDGATLSPIVKRICEIKDIINKKNDMDCSASFMIIMFRSLLSESRFDLLFDENMDPKDRNNFFKKLVTFFNLKTNEEIYNLIGFESAKDNSEGKQI